MLDKVTIINMFVKVVQLIKGVRKELTTELDALRRTNTVGGAIDDENIDSLDTTLSAKKIKDYVNEQIAELLKGEDAREEVINGVLDNLKAKVADTEGLLSVKTAQKLTDDEKLQALQNLGITKEFLVKMLVNDESTLGSDNVLSAKKVSDLISDAQLGAFSEDVVTEAEFDELMSANSLVPKPSKAGQILRTVDREGVVTLVWEDLVREEPDSGEPKVVVGDSTGDGSEHPLVEPEVRTESGESDAGILDEE